MTHLFTERQALFTSCTLHATAFCYTVRGDRHGFAEDSYGSASPRHAPSFSLDGRIMTAATDLPQILVIDDEMGPRESLRMLLKPN